MKNYIWKTKSPDEHTITLLHGFWSGKACIFVDDEMIYERPLNIFDSGLLHIFTRDGHEYTLHVNVCGFGFSYSLWVDGEQQEVYYTSSLSQETPELKRLITTMLGRDGALQGGVWGGCLGGIYGSLLVAAVHPPHPVVFVIGYMFRIGWVGAGVGMLMGFLWQRGVTAIRDWMVACLKTHRAHEIPLKYHPYWRKHLQIPPRLRSTLVIGIILPVLSLIIDPVVFRRSFFDVGFGGSLSWIQAFAYVASGIGMIGLLFWILVQEHTPQRASFLAGFLLAGALFSFGVGYMLLPITVFGVFAIVGICGVLPFVTAGMFFIHGFQAFQYATQHRKMIRRRIGMILVGAFVFFLIPGLVQWRVSYIASRAVEQILLANATTTEEATKTLKAIAWCSSQQIEQFIWHYQQETDALKQAHLSRTYHLITGKELEKVVEFRVD